MEGKGIFLVFAQGTRSHNNCPLVMRLEDRFKLFWLLKKICKHLSKSVPSISWTTLVDSLVMRLEDRLKLFWLLKKICKHLSTSVPSISWTTLVDYIEICTTLLTMPILYSILLDKWLETCIWLQGIHVSTNTLKICD